MSMYSCPARPRCPSPEQPAFGDVGLLDERVAFDLVGELFRALFVYVGQYDPRALLHHRSAMARPIPAPAPVAMARFPSSRLTPYRPCVRAPLPLLVTARIIAVWLGPRKRAARECCVPAKSYAPCTIGGATPIRGEHTVHPGRRPAAHGAHTKRRTCRLAARGCTGDRRFSRLLCGQRLRKRMVSAFCIAADALRAMRFVETTKPGPCSIAAL